MQPILTKRPVSKPRRFAGRLAGRILLLLPFGLLLASIAVIRTDYFVHRVVTERIVSLERSLGGELSTLKRLLGIDIDYSPAAFIGAIARGDEVAVSALVHAGIDPNVTDEQGKAAIFYAVEGSRVEILKYFITSHAKMDLRNPAGETPLHVAIARNDSEVTNFLLLYGADPNQRNAVGDTPLHTACREQNEGIVTMLLLRQANPNIANAAGITPLMEAVGTQHSEIIAALLEKGANVHMIAGERSTLALARDTGNPEITRLIAERAGTAAAAPEPPPVEATTTTTTTLPRVVMTRVRALGDPLAVWTVRSGHVVVSSIKAPVRNVGDVAAEEMSVRVTLPGGKEVELKGPSTLGRNEKATYSVESVQGTVPHVATLKAEIRCKNCYR